MILHIFTISEVLGVKPYQIIKFIKGKDMNKKKVFAVPLLTLATFAIGLTPAYAEFFRWTRRFTTTRTIRFI